jgi:PAS domain S-box-containing protein
LPRDAQAVLEKLEPVEREVTALEDGKSFIMRVLPYWATDGRIDGIVVTLIDITARKQAEEDHARLAAIVESSDDAIIAKNLNGTILSWNAGSERLFGYRADEVIGKPINMFIPPELQEEEEQILRRLSVGERIENFETVRLARDGRRIEVSVTASPIKDSQGRIVGASKIARDITSRKQAEEALRLAKEEWERTFDSVPDLIAILDNKHKVLRVNEAMASCLGLKPEECVGLPCYEAVHGTSGPPEFCPHSRTLTDGREHIEEVHEERLGRDLLVTTTPLHDEQGLMIGSVHVARDITERKQAEEERQTSVDFLRLVNESRNSADLIRAATLFFHEKSGCEAVGIRIKEGDDYPYFEAHGFPEEFVLMENRLCSYNENGEVIRDSKGDPIIECMCGNVICGRFDPTKPFFTNNGSFWTNCTTELLSSTTEADRQARTRNRCNGQGYESVALISLRMGEERLGLLQLNDRQQGRFSPATIDLWERLSGYLSVALTKFKAEEALHESEERFRTLANAIPQLCWMANADGWIFWYNQRWYEYTGTTAEQMEGWGWQSVHDPEVLPKVLEQWKASISTAKPFDMVFPLRGSDGVFRTFLTRGLPEYDHDGKVVRWFGTNTDISESKRAEEVLRTSYQRTDLLAEATARLLASDSPQKIIDELCRRVMGVLDCQAFFNFMMDAETGRLHLNACAGIPAEEVKKLEWLDYGVAVCGCAARDATRIVAEDIRNTPDPRTELVKSYGIQAYACHPLMAHGRVLGTLSFGTRNRPGFTDDELALMKTVADHVAIAMERKLAEEDLKLAREAAESASQAKSQFLANMSHELRTPMTGVLGMLEFALNTALDEQQQDFIETAHKSARALLRILNDILDLSKVEAGKLSIEENPFVLQDCVTGAIDILVPEARRKGLELNCAIAEDLPKIVVGDQVRLLQVLTNLLGNAVKYTERGEVKITVTPVSQTSSGKREINFIVTDSGIGIPAEKKEMIFQSFTQVDESHARRYGGVGLGLAICRELVERMGGAIACDSEEGRGSTFSFTIPFGDVRSERESVNISVEPPPVTIIPVSREVKRKRRLLLAEDDPISRKVIGLMLQHSNFDLDIAENGLQAVELWEKGNYDLVLMDVQMPGLDGFAATGAIREKERANGGHTLIVAMTAHALEKDQKRCIAAGMDAYISKPIDFKESIAMIEDLIAKRAVEAL